MTNVIIRAFDSADTQEVLNIIHRNSIEINSNDYGLEAMQKFVEICDADWLLKRVSFSHFYVAVDNEKVVGVGGIASYFGSVDESILLTIFVMPEYQKQGIGKMLVQALENDEYGIRAKRIEIPASITAVEFYLKLGYDYKNGIKELDEERHYRLEKKNEFKKASLV